MLPLCAVIPSVVRNLFYDHMKVFSCHAVSVITCKVVCSLQFVDGNEKNLTIRRDDLQ